MLAIPMFGVDHINLYSNGHHSIGTVAKRFVIVLNRVLLMLLVMCIDFDVSEGTHRIHRRIRADTDIDFKV